MEFKFLNRGSDRFCIQVGREVDLDLHPFINFRIFKEDSQPYASFKDKIGNIYVI